jgi:Ca2+-binding RTX toxin-like protein
MPAVFESFEARRLFALTPPGDPTPVGDILEPPTAKLSKTGTLQINGSPRRDLIYVSRDETTGATVIRFGGPTAVQMRRPVLPPGGFDGRKVKRIKVDAGGGSDAITFTRSDAKIIPVTINAGKGDDTILAVGRGLILAGGSGDDTITSRQYGYNRYTQAERDLFVTHPAGDDVGSVSDTAMINGKLVTKEEAFSLAILASGNRLEGGDGNDTFESSGGDDSLFGGAGTDHYHASSPLLEIFHADLADQPIVTADRNSVRSRLATFGVGDVTTITVGSPTYVRADSLDDIGH